MVTILKDIVKKETIKIELNDPALRNIIFLIDKQIKEYNTGNIETKISHIRDVMYLNELKDKIESLF